MILKLDYCNQEGCYSCASNFLRRILNFPSNSYWTGKDVNIYDPVEVELARHLKMSALAHVARSTSFAYVGPWNAFVLWCGSLMRSRRPLCAYDLTVELYFQSLLDRANMFSTIKSTSAFIAFFIRLFYLLIILLGLPKYVWREPWPQESLTY